MAGLSLSRGCRNCSGPCSVTLPGRESRSCCEQRRLPQSCPVDRAIRPFCVRGHGLSASPGGSRWVCHTHACPCLLVSTSAFPPNVWLSERMGPRKGNISASADAADGFPREILRTCHLPPSGCRTLPLCTLSRPDYSPCGWNAQLSGGDQPSSPSWPARRSLFCEGPVLWLRFPADLKMLLIYSGQAPICTCGLLPRHSHVQSFSPWGLKHYLYFLG